MTIVYLAARAVVERGHSIITEAFGVATMPMQLQAFILNEHSTLAAQAPVRDELGNAIGVVTCVYVNPETKQFWVIDFRVYDLEGDEQSKIAHMLAMHDNVRYSKKLSFRTVLMDSWYASMQGIKHIEALGKVYYCPIKANRESTCWR